MLFKVPSGTSLPGLPAMVVRPGLVGCLYCLWLPVVWWTYQPSCSMSLIRSRNFKRSPRPVYAARGQKLSNWPKILSYEEKLEPQPQLLVELGLMKLKPWRMRVSSKSRTMPVR